MKQHRKTILVVDDSPDLLVLLRKQLEARDHIVFTAPGVMDAVTILESEMLDLLITDMRMPGIGGLQLVKYARIKRPDLPILVITGFPSVESAVEAVKFGATEYLVKPFTANELYQSIENISGQKQHVESSDKENTETKEEDTFGIIGTHPLIVSLREHIRKASGNNATVLIQGESGTGKELVARAIHYEGKGAGKPFVAINCGAIPESLLESELFGFVKGAFTGAQESRIGLLIAADKGTVFLDEINATSPAFQAKLLRVLQDREVRMIGSTKAQQLDIRIIAAGNSLLEDMVERGTFRMDLFYRLNVVRINVPPLRDRTTDIPLLVSHFMEKFKREYAKHHMEISPIAIEGLKRYDWPGNVRELENTIQRLVIECDRSIEYDDLPVVKSRKTVTVSVQQDKFLTLKEMEEHYIRQVLEHTGNNKTEAARILGIDRKTLREKLK
ncbi:MAG TPA: sigma-54 dependent transcriptional regulator [Flavobacteriales bacterium]|nr:sigma-54 dependent transcriptional regulator [Flavobacteriales bacterium]HRE95964.1 sigma-54 dependent transcriptional regulator [Flavobacteriales bacterium]HRJ35098.1 sigma-54 dependent transcriptional regulator [Flavobacteriales bacterium]HRJ38164.1 sigma-54 dependent transcriptional regulator [Flavobacteriales bacterium]